MNLPLPMIIAVTFNQSTHVQVVAMPTYFVPFVIMAATVSKVPYESPHVPVVVVELTLF